MLPITALPRIALKKTQKARDVLDDFLMNKIISGYNWFTAVPDSAQIITFSHMHETQTYQNAMVNDLARIGYSRQELLNKMRTKYGCYRWEADFIFRNDAGVLFPDLRIRKKSGEYFNLERYPGKTLGDVAELQHEQLIGENAGWELDITFKEKKDLLALVDLFITKSSRKSHGHWPDAYDVPVLLIGEKAVEYAAELPDFAEARRIALVENGNEINFVVHTKYNELKKASTFPILQELGFHEEHCLANRTFLEAYVG